MPEPAWPHQSQISPGQDDNAAIQRREALIKLGKYTAYATPILLATVTAAQAVSAPAPTPAPPVSDVRLKMNITPVAVLSNGLTLYSYQLRHDPTTTYVGLLAQDLLESKNPDFRQAVMVRPDGYYAVKYHELGLKMFSLDEWRAASVELAAA
jgi:hypothetical protein